MPTRLLRWGLFIFAALSVCPLLAGTPDNALTPYEQRAGWKLLFDGKSADQWRGYKQDKLNSGWAVKEGALVRAADGAGDIVSKDQYDNFELSLMYKISPEGNSGLMFHVAETEDTPWMTGPEIQIQDNEKGHDPQKSGWLYQLYTPGKDWGSGQIPDATRPAGEWNRLQVRITEAQCEINLNGISYGGFVKGSKDWDARVAKSKFASMKNFGKPKKGHISLQDHGNAVEFKNIKIRALPPNGAGPDPIDGYLPVKVEQAFPKIKWTGWEPENASGQSEAFRPIVITNAGDGSNRLFVATQQGVIHTFVNKPDVTESQVFHDMSKKVRYFDKENEEGFLGLALHPKFKENGQFFVYYTAKHTPHLSVISRFRVFKDDPNKADPEFEEELLRIPQPAWNHNGGTLVFGPDGYLYIGLGDGGFGNDPQGNGQNNGTLLGKMLRIDVDHKSDGKTYAIPADNPFIKEPGAKPEIFANGFRNIWRMAFDRATGDLWAADVGQNLWEEIDIVTKGGNYGWSGLEGTYQFGSRSYKIDNAIPPIWEYDHQVGKSITGGVVYRGTKVPALAGHYLYADYVTGKLWALKADAKKRTVAGNYGIKSPMFPVITYGEDEAGEVYFSTVTPDGKGIYRFAAE